MSQASFKESPKKQQKPTNKSKEPPTLPWDRSYEESKKVSNAQVTDHFKKKKPEKKHKPINQNDLKFFKGMREANKKKFIPPLDYNHQITKSFEKRK